MKKNIFLFLFILSSRLIFAQVSCNEENLSNDFESGIPSNSNGLFSNQIVATDLTIPADTNMSLTTINTNLWIEYQSSGQTGGSIVDAVITIYNDANGLPGSEVTSYSGIEPSSQELLGTQFGFIEVFDVSFDIPATNLEGQLGEDTTYWISVFFTIAGANATNGNWEVTSTSSVGNQIAFSLDLGTTWEISSDFDGVYSFEGDCTDISSSVSCSEENLSNDFESGIPSNSNGLFSNQIVATDLTIPTDTNMSLTTINTNLWIEYQSSGQTGGSIVDAVITIYNDDNGLPGSEVASYSGIEPSSQELLGTQFGFIEVFDVSFDIPTTNLEGQLGEDTTYWVSVFFTIAGANATNGNWEVTSTSSVGNQIAFSLDLGTTWEISSDFDGVYSFEGDCTSMTLNVQENLFQEFSFYPNPVKDIVYFQMREDVERLQMYTVLGQKIIDTKVEPRLEQLSMSDLNPGMYILSVTISGETRNYRLIKE